MKFLTNLFRKWMSRDDRVTPSVYQVLLWCLGGIVLFIIGPWLVQVPGLIGLISAMAVLYVAKDMFQLFRLGIPTVQVQSEDVAQLGLEFQITTSVEFRLSKRWSIRILRHFEKVLQDIRIDHGFPWYVQLCSSQSASTSIVAEDALDVSFRFTYGSLQRGLVQSERVDVAWHSPFRMWRRLHRYPAMPSFVVYPDITTWRNDVLHIYKQMDGDGRHIRRLVSGDQEFDYIADYTLDDDPRRINWAASARQGRTMKNVFMPEKGQHVVIAVDASRYMAIRLDNGKTRFDLAVESALALIQTAVRAGDYVTVVVFSNRVEWASMHEKGMSCFHRAMERLAKVEPRLVQGGYESLFRFLETRIHRRAWVVILSELEGVRTDVAFLPNFAESHKRHPTLFITMADIEAINVADQTPTRRTFAKWTAANWRIEQRQKVVSHLQRSNVAVVESLPGSMVIDTVRTYLKKRRRFSL